MAIIKQRLTDEDLAALRAISEPAAQLQYRALCADQHPGMLFVYDNLRLNNSPEHAYRIVCELDQIFKNNGIREELPHDNRAHKPQHSDPGAFNPGGRHLRVLPDGNIAMSQDRRDPYAARHLHAEGTEIISQRLR